MIRQPLHCASVTAHAALRTPATRRASRGARPLRPSSGKPRGGNLKPTYTLLRYKKGNYATAVAIGFMAPQKADGELGRDTLTSLRAGGS